MPPIGIAENPRKWTYLKCTHNQGAAKVILASIANREKCKQCLSEGMFASGPRQIK